jgi:hypothetical protein
MAVTTSSIVMLAVTLFSTERIVPLKCQLYLDYMALQCRSDSSRIDVDCYVALCGGLSIQTKANSSVSHTTYLFTFSLFNDNIDGFVVTRDVYCELQRRLV